jgi:hypothetical protein
VLAAKVFHSLREGTGAQIRAPAHDDSRRFAPGVGINHPDSLTFFTRHCTSDPTATLPKKISSTLVALQRHGYIVLYGRNAQFLKMFGTRSTNMRVARRGSLQVQHAV